MGRGNIGKSIPLYLVDDSPSSLTYNAPVPKFFSQTIAKIMVFLHIDFDIANRKIVTFQANSIGIRLWLPVLSSTPFLVKLSSLVYAFGRIPRQESIDFFVL